MKNKAFILLLFLFLPLIGAGQKGYKRALDYIAVHDFQSAIPLLEDMVVNKGFPEATWQLAECHRKSGNWKAAEKYYADIISIPDFHPESYLHYGLSLQRNGKCEAAQSWFDVYVAHRPTDQRGRHLQKACDYEERLLTKSLDVYQVNHLSFNTPFDDICPSFYGQGIVFSSEFSPENSTSSTKAPVPAPFFSTYYVGMKALKRTNDCNALRFSTPSKFSNTFNSKWHDAVFSFSNDYKTVYFTRNTIKGGKGKENKVHLKIFISSYNEATNTWAEPKQASFCEGDYSFAHPALSPDGNTLYFASNMPGGYGGADIYSVRRTPDGWSKPKNLGAKINTEGNEVFPFIHEKDQLFFASDGQIGLGGLDIYSIDISKEGSLSLPQNLGYPINSSEDDFGIIFNKNQDAGFLTSNRDGGKGKGDIYSFCKNASPITIHVIDDDTGLPLPGVALQEVRTNHVYKTNTQGNVQLDVVPNSCFTFNISRKHYLPITKQLCTGPSGKIVEKEIRLEKELSFYAEGVVFDENDLPMSGATIRLMNPKKPQNNTFILTDKSGRFKFELEHDQCFVLACEKTGYQAAQLPSRCTDSFLGYTNFKVKFNMLPGDSYFTELSSPNSVLPEESNDIVALKGGGSVSEANTAELEFDFAISDGIRHCSDEDPIPYLLKVAFFSDSEKLRANSLTELRKLAQFLRYNPDLVIEISVHSEQRGSKWQTFRLSQLRALELQNWLFENGVSQPRVVALGYGDGLLLKDCKHEPCSNRDHENNNRVEFRIIDQQED